MRWLDSPVDPRSDCSQRRRPQDSYALRFGDASSANAVITAKDGIPLRAWTLEPEHWNGSAVIVLHGIGDTHSGMRGLASMLAQRLPRSHSRQPGERRERPRPCHLRLARTRRLAALGRLGGNTMAPGPDPECCKGRIRDGGTNPRFLAARLAGPQLDVAVDRRLVSAVGRTRVRVRPAAVWFRIIKGFTGRGFENNHDSGAFDSRNRRHEYPDRAFPPPDARATGGDGVVGSSRRPACCGLRCLAGPV